LSVLGRKQTSDLDWKKKSSAGSQGARWPVRESGSTLFSGNAATVVSIPGDIINPTIHSSFSQYSGRMGLRCLIRAHRPMLTSIVRREGRYAALCDDCGLPIERSETGRWAASMPLVARRVQKAPASGS